MGDLDGVSLGFVEGMMDFDGFELREGATVVGAFVGERKALVAAEDCEGVFDVPVGQEL